MNKLWMHAWANIRKSKSVSVTLAVMFIIAALLLNVGLLVTINYGGYFDALKDELLPADVYFMIPDALYTDEVESYIDTSGHITKTRTYDGLWLGSNIYYNGKEQSFTVLFNDMDEERDICKWKYVGDHLPADDTSIYVPDIFKAVGGYQLNDKITLKYTDVITDEEKTLELTVKGYTEDIFFSSTDTGCIGFYLPSAAYQKLENILNDPMYSVHVAFAELDDINNASAVEAGIRDILQLNSASMMAADASSLLVVIDIELIEMSRCMMATMVSVMMVVFAMIIVVVCLLVVRFRIANSIEDDIVKIGSLKSIGYTSHQIIISVLLQFLLIASIGSVAGIALSYPALPFVSAVFEQQSGLKWEQGFDAAISLTAFFILLIVVTIVALASARHITGLSPINALRGETASRKYKNNHLQLEKAKGQLTTALAFKSILQNMKQTAMIMVILVAVTFAGSFGIIMFYNTTVDTKAFAEVPGMEICNVIAILNPDKERSEAEETIRNMESVRKAHYFDEVKIKVDGSEVAAFVMDDYSQKDSDLVYEGRYPNTKNEIVLAGILSERINKKIGDTVSVCFGDNEEKFKIVGLSNGSSMGGMNTSVLTEDFRRLNPEHKQQSFYIYLDKGTDAVKFIEKLKKKFDKELLLGTVNFDEALAEGMASYQNIVAVMGVAMLVITLFVVTLVLYFIISSSVIRKKRELGIQKAIGFTTFQLMNQISMSFTVPILIGDAVGSFLGAVYTNPLLSLGMKGMGIMKARFIVDPYWVVIFGAVTVVFAYLLSLLITWRIRKISAYALVTE